MLKLVVQALLYINLEVSLQANSPNMKWIGTSILLFLSGSLFAQLSGIVADRATRFPVSNVKTDTLPLLLKQKAIVLKEVTIRAKPDYRFDSIRNRKDYSSVFYYKTPGLKSIFIPKSLYTSVPTFPGIATNNTSSIVSLNLLQVVSLLTRNNAHVSKLQKTLLKNEENNYLDEVFSKQKVTAETGLKGDSLNSFMDRYRPSISEAKKMTPYDQIVYIKKSYAEFIKTYRNENSSPFIK